ncbi:hypothetical protein A9W98_29150 [Mycobacterium gordonae]|uniref:DUF202 domain-containing protein n=1 Tax=Mycobacterium gordonae TaxID=1778 RepID=A0A1A6BBC1_MYCGO|nr:DUF202 domain-containing protein [Mycobacterium gordonae]MBI2698312.1 DUF202 domain-containing protein [Mycobacterium sp.]MBX9983621.1 DUF202 domain-containing protein [Mycobacterium gordonae]MCQ4361556.1 DUF202 domain-containing protein [Mycobacterium gordonae]OBR99619.1 hypothetical protein A9W98_29150 [Mycobacterium gordonae]
MTGPGGPAERTTLAWSRTSFAFLVNGVLLALKDIHGAGHRLGALLPAGVACVAASATYVIARRRQHTLAQRPLPTPITARRQVYIIGIATLVLTITTAITQLL